MSIITLGSFSPVGSSDSFLAAKTSDNVLHPILNDNDEMLYVSENGLEGFMEFEAASGGVSGIQLSNVSYADGWEPIEGYDLSNLGSPIRYEVTTNPEVMEQGSETVLKINGISIFEWESLGTTDQVEFSAEIEPF